jgi:hypothetical protein
VMKRLSSLRNTLAPIPSTPIAFLPVGPLHPRKAKDAGRSHQTVLADNRLQ